MKYNKITWTIFPVVSMLFIVFIFTSCARKISFQSSSIVPAAEGTVTVKKDKNNNYNIELNVMQLADPKRLDPPKDIYIVWMDTEQNGAKNIGQIKTSGSLMSKTLRSSLKTVSSFKPVDFFITAEDNGDVHEPGRVVLKTGSF